MIFIIELHGNATRHIESFYARDKFVIKASYVTHVLICGDLSTSQIKEFFKELLHEDHSSHKMHAVILQKDKPSKEVIAILKDHRYAKHVSKCLSICKLFYYL